MNSETTTFSPGPTPDTVRAPDGTVHAVPAGWVLVPPGDAALTRRIRAAGECWSVAVKKGRKVFSRGVWAPAATVKTVRTDLDAERATAEYTRRRAYDASRREKVQTEYVEEFRSAILAFLAFHPNHAELAGKLARAVADHATPVGSGTVARTKRIPVAERAEAAVIAWLRHQTTAYDSMVIPRVKGKRREVRRMLARRSAELLDRYRASPDSPEGCPLRKALGGSPDAGAVLRRTQ